MSDTPLAAPSGPSWLAPLVTLITQVGVPTVVAGVLLWFVLVRVDSALQYIQAQEDKRTQFVAAMEANFIEAIEAQTRAYVSAMDRNIETNKQIAELARQHAARYPASEK